MIFRKCENGQIFICNKCQKIHLEFGNFTFDFTSEIKLRDFLENLEQIDGSYYEALNKPSAYVRKIIVPVPNSSLKILFTSEELHEIRNLIRGFMGRNKKELVTITRIEFDFNAFAPKHLN